MKAIEIISDSWDGVKPSCMNGVWCKIWSDCIHRTCAAENDDVRFASFRFFFLTSREICLIEKSKPTPFCRIRKPLNERKKAQMIKKELS